MRHWYNGWASGRRHSCRIACIAHGYGRRVIMLQTAWRTRADPFPGEESLHGHDNASYRSSLSQRYPSIRLTLRASCWVNTLVHGLREGRLAGRIVETEAYPVGDSTNHVWPGRRASTARCFSSAGTRMCGSPTASTT